MKKTGNSIEKDVYDLISASELASSISGELYREGTRPIVSDKEDSKEDVVISFMTGLDNDDIQTGVVNINTYIPDINNGGKSKVKDVARCNEIETICLSVVENLSSDNYKFSLGAIIQTFQAREIEQHFVNVKLEFKYITF